LQPVLFPGETKEEAGAMDMQLSLEECDDLLSDLDAPDDEE
jgi:hypothetical protein